MKKRKLNFYRLKSSMEKRDWPEIEEQLAGESFEGGGQKTIFEELNKSF